MRKKGALKGKKKQTVIVVANVKNKNKSQELFAVCLAKRLANYERAWNRGLLAKKKRESKIRLAETPRAQLFFFKEKRANDATRKEKGVKS